MTNWCSLIRILCSEIGETVESSDSELVASGGEVLEAQVVGVSELMRKNICYRCKGHVEPSCEEEVPSLGNVVVTSVSVLQRTYLHHSQD